MDPQHSYIIESVSMHIMYVKMIYYIYTYIYIIQLLHCYNKDYFLQLVFFPGSETLQFGGAECFKLKPYWTRIPLQLDQKESSFDATSHRTVSTHLIIGDHHPIFLVGN